MEDLQLIRWQSKALMLLNKVSGYKAVLYSACLKVFACRWTTLLISAMQGLLFGYVEGSIPPTRDFQGRPHVDMRCQKQPCQGLLVDKRCA